MIKILCSADAFPLLNAIHPEAATLIYYAVWEALCFIFRITELVHLAMVHNCKRMGIKHLLAMAWFVDLLKDISEYVVLN